MRGILLYSVRDASAQPWIRAGTTSQTLAPHGSRAGRREEHRSLLLVTLSAGPLAQDAATRRCCLGLPSARPSDLHPPRLSLIPESPPLLSTPTWPGGRAAGAVFLLRSTPADRRKFNLHSAAPVDEQSAFLSCFVFAS